MAWRYDLPKCPVSREDRGEFMMPNCKYCGDNGPSHGFLWTDNNGPIVACPVCNADYDTAKARRDRDFDAAERQRREGKS